MSANKALRSTVVTPMAPAYGSRAARRKNLGDGGGVRSAPRDERAQRGRANVAAAPPPGEGALLLLLSAGLARRARARRLARPALPAPARTRCRSAVVAAHGGCSLDRRRSAGDVGGTGRARRRAL